MLDIAAQTGTVEQKEYLKPELLCKTQTLGPAQSDPDPV